MLRKFCFSFEHVLFFFKKNIMAPCVSGGCVTLTSFRVIIFGCCPYLRRISISSDGSFLALSIIWHKNRKTQDMLWETHNCNFTLSRYSQDAQSMLFGCSLSHNPSLIPLVHMHLQHFIDWLWRCVWGQTLNAMPQTVKALYICSKPLYYYQHAVVYLNTF